jgi:hypothetical protein
MSLRSTGTPVLTERNRAVLHRRLSEMVGDEEAVSEMLSNVPDDERFRPASESFVETFVEKKLAEVTTQLVMWIVGTAIALAAVILTAIGMWA